MLKKISITIELICPNCGAQAKHEHEFKLRSSLKKYNEKKLTAIGHTERLYEDSINFNCPQCKCWHCAEMEPIEVHIHPEIKIIPNKSNVLPPPPAIPNAKDNWVWRRMEMFKVGKCVRQYDYDNKCYAYGKIVAVCDTHISVMWDHLSNVCDHKKDDIKTLEIIPNWAKCETKNKYE